MILAEHHCISRWPPSFPMADLFRSWASELPSSERILIPEICLRVIVCRKRKHCCTENVSILCWTELGRSIPAVVSNKMDAIWHGVDTNLLYATITTVTPAICCFSPSESKWDTRSDSTLRAQSVNFWSRSKHPESHVTDLSHSEQPHILNL